MSLSSLDWRKSRRCDAGTCVEVASLKDEIVIRDSKDPDGPVLHFTRDEWTAFVDGVRDGDFTFN
ncbi:MAG: DUF397 domain-containing protein [Hamadaea sp.]|uniref:DUF397 domain-containing protein n=1 Tax=Hamadaea sp. TaxID=2024425 RepID=UPI0017CF1756|nr:DUF397 domain-containing protein [Hamadaea sp.]NUR73358.1 DUF397 domain-containing protein [Hamadaea sp.]NUT21274.1 DUF397 domain-containing protein [Hamadaea sp.]